MSAGNGSLIALGKELRRRREARGLSVEQLAKRAGLSARALGLIEKGERDPSTMILVAIARELGVPVGTLLQEAGAAPTIPPTSPPRW